LIELETVQRALRQLQALKPARHELLQLNSIRATVCACQKPLQDFLDKISKFERRLGAFNAGNQKWKGFPRRIQFRVTFKDDIKELRCFLASHIATINMLLMTQAVSSISLAETDRYALATGLESKILENRRLLVGIGDNVNLTLAQQRNMRNHLHQQDSTLEELGNKQDGTNDRLRDQTAVIQSVRNTAGQTHTQTTSILGATTQILAMVTSGLVRLDVISQQLGRMLQICANFTIEMRTAMHQILDTFSSIHSILLRVDQNLPRQPSLPIVLLTTALGEVMVLPYQLCQDWRTFKQLLRVIFLDRPGRHRVLAGMYSIMNKQGGRIIQEHSWRHAISQGDHLSMSMILEEPSADSNTCPFPTCQASTTDAQIENGGHRCSKCGRWSMVTAKAASPLLSREDIHSRRLSGAYTAGTDAAFEGSGIEEDVELYRQILVQKSSEIRDPNLDREPSHALQWLEHAFQSGFIYDDCWRCQECGTINEAKHGPRCRGCPYG
jgi:hypothetical protein